MKSILDICYSAETNQRLDLHLPEGEAFPVFVYFHGGGLEAGDKADGSFFYDYLTAHGVAVVSVNYRMYPRAKYPDFLVDAAAAVAWVLKNIRDFGCPEGIYVGGSSAGGYISQMLCFDKRWLAAQGISPLEISGFVHDAGQPTCHFNVLRERGIDSRRVIIDDSAPLYHIGEEKEYSPMLIIVSDNDMENRYAQTMLLVSTLAHFGHRDHVRLKVMQGSHCAYLGAADENGESIFGKLVSRFIFGI